MDSCHEVSTPEQLEQFIRRVGSFHDGILKDDHCVNRDYVEKSLSISPYQLSHARVRVQRQWSDPPAVEMSLERVWSLRLDAVDFIVDSAAATEQPSALLLRLGSSKITFERLVWREAPEWMGDEPRFGPFSTP